MKKHLVFILALILSLSFCGCGEAVDQTVKERAVVSSSLAEDDKAFIITEAGVIDAGGDVSTYITPDRKHIITLDEEGVLSYSDGEMTSVTAVSQTAASVSSDEIRNDGFFYERDSGDTYRVIFGEEEQVKITEFTNDTYEIASNTTSVLFSHGGSIYILASGSFEKKQVGTAEDGFYAASVSDDATMAAWLLSSDDCEWTPVLYCNNDKKMCSTCMSKYSYYPEFGIRFSCDQSLMVAASYRDNRLYIAKADGEIVTVTLPDNVSNFSYCCQGLISDTKASDIDAVIVSVETDGYSKNLYRVTLDGEKERILSNVYSPNVAGGIVVYANSDFDLYYCDISTGNVGDEVRITGDIESFAVSKSGKYVYILKEPDGGYPLYMYKVGSDSPVKVTSEAFADDYYSYFDIINTDEDTIFYLMNAENISGSYSKYYGDLYSWTYSADKPESIKIASDVILGSLTSYYADESIDKDNFCFRRFNGIITKDGDSYISYDLMNWDGKNTTNLCANLYGSLYY